jgi:hypothetical protein
MGNENITISGNQIPRAWIGINVGRGYDADTKNIFVIGNYVANCSSGIQFTYLGNGYAYAAHNTLVDAKNITLIDSLNVELVDNIIIISGTPNPTINWFEYGFYILIGVAAALIAVIVIQTVRGRKS